MHSRKNGPPPFLNCAIASPAAATSIDVDDSFEVGGTNWRGGGITYIVYKLVNSNGKIAVCGAFFNEGPVPGHVDVKLLRSARVRLGQKTLIGNLSYFTRLRDDRPLTAKCKLTTSAWSANVPNMKTEIKFNTRTFEY